MTYLIDFLAVASPEKIIGDTLDTFSSAVDWLKVAITFICSISLAAYMVKLWLEA